jgi:hypothetical protein
MDSEYEINQFTKRPVKIGGRAWINYHKKLKRSQEDAELVKKAEKRFLKKKKKYSEESAYTDSDSEEEEKHVAPKNKAKKKAAKPKKSAKDGMERLRQILEDAGDGDVDNATLEAMFENLLA